VTQNFCVFCHFHGIFDKESAAHTASQQQWVSASCEQDSESAAATDIEPEVSQASAKTESRKSDVNTLALVQ
jgi:hypothetical protein